MSMEFRGTTICAVKKDGVTAIAGDGQVTFGESVVFKRLVNKLVQPYVGFSYKNKKSGASYPIQDIVAFCNTEKYPIVPTQIALENLERLRLIEINRNSKYANDDEYIKIKKCNRLHTNQNYYDRIIFRNI